MRFFPNETCQCSEPCAKEDGRPYGGKCQRETALTLNPTPQEQEEKRGEGAWVEERREVRLTLRGIEVGLNSLVGYLEDTEGPLHPSEIADLCSDLSRFSKEAREGQASPLFQAPAPSSSPASSDTETETRAVPFDKWASLNPGDRPPPQKAPTEGDAG